MSVILTVSMKQGWCDFAQHRLSELGIHSPAEPERIGMGVDQLIERMSSYRANETSGAADGRAIFGKTWEIAAAELVIANADKPSWGWADPRNLDFLEFWQEFEPTAKFVLIYGSPSDSLSYDLNERRSAARDHRSALKKWAIYHETLLKFYHKHRHKCALMHIDSFSGNDEGFAAALEQKFGIELRRSLQARHLNRSAINNVIAERLCDEMLAEQALFVELNDSADMPQIQRNNGEDEWLSDMFAELQTWAETLDRAQQLERENLRQKSLIEQLEGNIEVWENSDAVADLQLTELQLRQVQEELHFYFSEYQKLQQETTFPNLSGSEYLQGHASSDALVLDLRAVVNGSGWHNSEANGRWAGDADIATLKLPTFPQVDAELRMRIVDTMSLEHLDALQVTLNGQRLNGRIIRICDVGGRLAPLRRLKAKLQKVEKPLPAELIARVSARDIAAPGVENELEIRFPKPVSPTSSGHSDARKLSVCVQTVRLSKVG